MTLSLPLSNRRLNQNSIAEFRISQTFSSPLFLLPDRTLFLSRQLKTRPFLLPASPGGCSFSDARSSSSVGFVVSSTGTP